MKNVKIWKPENYNLNVQNSAKKTCKNKLQNKMQIRRSKKKHE